MVTLTLSDANISGYWIFNHHVYFIHVRERLFHLTPKNSIHKIPQVDSDYWLGMNEEESDGNTSYEEAYDAHVKNDLKKYGLTYKAEREIEIITKKKTIPEEQKSGAVV